MPGTRRRSTPGSECAKIGGWTRPGSLLATPLQGWEANGESYHPVQPVASGARGGWLRSRVLGLELRSQRQDGATVLVFRDPRTGEEFDGDLAEAERLRRAAEERASAEAQRANAEAVLRQSAEELASAESKRASAEAERRRAARGASAGIGEATPDNRY